MQKKQFLEQRKPVHITAIGRPIAGDRGPVTPGVTPVEAVLLIKLIGDRTWSVVKKPEEISLQPGEAFLEVRKDMSGIMHNGVGPSQIIETLVDPCKKGWDLDLIRLFFGLKRPQ